MHHNHLTENDYLRLHYRGNVEPAKRVPKNPPQGDGRKPLPTHVPAPPAAPTDSNKRPSFLTLKNIVMDMDSLTAEQKLELIDKISDLYA